MKDYRERKYTVVSYDEKWKEVFQEEALHLKDILGEDALDIEHIGSTAIPGSSGKPTLDILVLVGKIGIVEKYREKIEALGYKFLGEYVKENSFLFVKEENHTRLVQLHFFPKEHTHVQKMLKVRDYLRTHSDEALKYTEFKKELFKKYPDNYEQYKRLKSEYLEKLTQKALEVLK